MALRFRRVRPRLTRRRYRRRPRMARMARRSIYNPMPTFTETVDLQSIVMNYQAPGVGFAKGIFQIQPSQIPQMANYAALYNQIKIRKVKLMIIPNYNFESANGTGGGAPIAPAVSLTRLAYAINNTSGAIPPGVELDVLEDNACKIVTMERPRYITFRPVAELGLSNPSAVPVATSSRNTWITTNPTGLATQFGGVSYFFTQDYCTNNPPVLFNVYAKITFSLRDPK